MIVTARTRRLFVSLWVLIGWGVTEHGRPFWSWGSAHANQIRFEPIITTAGRN